MPNAKPIRVLWSPLSQRFYATRAWKQERPGVVTVTGEKFDVTDDIAYYILTNQITFSPPKGQGVILADNEIEPKP